MITNPDSCLCLNPHCDEWFIPRRSDKKFCNDKCKSAHNNIINRGVATLRELRQSHAEKIINTLCEIPEFGEATIDLTDLISAGLDFTACDIVKADNGFEYYVTPNFSMQVTDDLTVIVFPFRIEPE